jgi:hypothetical protein
MNSKTDEKPVHESGSNEQPTGTVLRLVPRTQREREGTPTSSARRTTNHDVDPTIWGGDDDDPGPTAA